VSRLANLFPKLKLPRGGASSEIIKQSHTIGGTHHEPGRPMGRCPAAPQSLRMASMAREVLSISTSGPYL